MIVSKDSSAETPPVLSPGQIHPEGAEILEVAEPTADHLDVERVVVGGHQPVAVEQQLGQVADPTPRLQDILADEGGDLAVHPTVERTGVANRDEDVVAIVRREPGVQEPALDASPRGPGCRRSSGSSFPRRRSGPRS